MPPIPRNLCKMIDYTLLSPTASVQEVKELCLEALKYKVATVSVAPIFVPMCVKLLKDSSVKVSTVIGYPLGSNTTEAKAFQTRQLVKEGAEEVDMVFNLGAFKSGVTDLVRADIKAVVDAAKISSRGYGALVKVIIETCYLSQSEIDTACRLAIEGEADFIQTSTEDAPRGALVEDVNLIRKIVGREIGVKAAGSLEDLETIRKMLDAGANRIGTVFGRELFLAKKS